MEIEHGTLQGYRQHLKDGTATCDPCREANRAAIREYRHKSGKSRGTWVYVPDDPEELIAAIHRDNYQNEYVIGGIVHWLVEHQNQGGVRIK